MSDSDWVTVALLGKVRGNRGELTAISLTSKPGRLEALREVWLFGNGARYQVESVWEHKGSPVFKFAGVDSISDAELLQGCEVRVPMAERAPLDLGEYYDSDLIGCEVVDRATGRVLGAVTAMPQGGLLEMNGEILIPFAKEICVSVDIPARRILVDLPEGLLELNRP